MMKIIFLLLVRSLLTSAYSNLHHSKSKLIIPKSPVYSQKRRYERSSRLYVVEHLIDCTANPAIAELYGNLAKDYCLKPPDGSTSSLFRGLGGLLEQAATIGFLVMSYFFFKRTANGISEWEDDDDDEDESIRSNDDTNVKKNSQGSQASEMRRCPQCNGLGKFEFDGENASVSICDLCEGSGSIRKSKRAKPLGLPQSSRQLWSDGFNSGDDRQ
mmetsp:Transcript_18142/g.17478  ORF Transcript_18142/g.17478 Transcript_18142/m.17478 type:complete len:215 (-) Transcript_18142:104-748(-)